MFIQSTKNNNGERTKMANEPKVSIIIRARNNWHLTKACMDSIERNTDPELYRLIVVNDGSVDETREELKKMLNIEYHSQHIFIHHEKPKGAVSATNSGIDVVLRIPTPYILVLDNDTEILEGNTSWLSDMIKYFEEDETVGIVGACTDMVIGMQKVDKLHINDAPKFLISFAWMMSLKCVKKCGPLDIRYDPGNFEDIDYSITATQKGFTLKVAKDVFINHYLHRTFKDMDLDNLLIINERKGLEKWGEKIYYNMRR